MVTSQTFVPICCFQSCCETAYGQTYQQFATVCEAEINMRYQPCLEVYVPLHQNILALKGLFLHFPIFSLQVTSCLSGKSSCNDLSGQSGTEPWFPCHLQSAMCPLLSSLYFPSRKPQRLPTGNDHWPMQILNCANKIWERTIYSVLYVPWKDYSLTPFHLVVQIQKACARRVVSFLVYMYRSK